MLALYSGDSAEVRLSDNPALTVGPSVVPILLAATGNHIPTFYPAWNSWIPSLFPPARTLYFWCPWDPCSSKTRIPFFLCGLCTPPHTLFKDWSPVSTEAVPCGPPLLYWQHPQLLQVVAASNSSSPVGLVQHRPGQGLRWTNSTGFLLDGSSTCEHSPNACSSPGHHLWLAGHRGAFHPNSRQKPGFGDRYLYLGIMSFLFHLSFCALYFLEVKFTYKMNSS